MLADGVAAIETGPDGRARAVRTASGRTLPADLVVLGLGVRPNVELARDGGHPAGNVRWRSPSTTGCAPRSTACGPRATASSRCTASPGSGSWSRSGTHANKQGRVAGINIGGGYATFPGVIGTAVTKVCDLEVARTGLSEAEAELAGYRFVTASVDSTTKAGYFPGATPIRLKLVAELRSGRLLGAQIVGRDNAAKRIDVLATAIWNEMDVDEILSLDLSYAPPFSPVWDPVLIAARKAFESVEAESAA